MRFLMNALAVLEYRLNIVASATAQAFDDAYDLIVVDDEATPLSGGLPAHNYYPSAIIAVIILALLAILVVWLVRRNNYKTHLLELREKAGDHTSSVPFTIRGIKDEIKLAESNLL